LRAALSARLQAALSAREALSRLRVSYAIRLCSFARCSCIAPQFASKCARVCVSASMLVEYYAQPWSVAQFEFADAGNMHKLIWVR
jgi:hypothetical protein